MTSIARLLPAFVLFTLSSVAGCGADGERPPPIGEGGNTRTPPIVIENGGRANGGDAGTGLTGSSFGGASGGASGGDGALGGADSGGSPSFAGTFSFGGFDGSAGSLSGVSGTFSTGGF